MKKTTVVILVLTFSLNCFSQSDTLHTEKPQVSTEKKWYDNFSIRGYSQVRYNRLLETNKNLGCEQCDRSWGDDGGIFVRRLRIIFFGQISKQVYFYIQPDFVSSASSERLNFAQIRDVYFDIGIDKDNEYRLRIGQSKIPFGFENMQSSQNRLTLDRNDALNSALSNERDVGVFFYWAPKKKRELLSNLVRTGLKGSGDYGIFGFGVYNGQTANQPERNDKLHVASRITYPFELKNQILELSLQGYTGKFVIPESNLTKGVKHTADLNYLDRRVAASFILYPKPFGIMAEYNVGKGPEYNKRTDSIETKDLKGGYATLSYQLNYKQQLIIPFTRIQYYDGGKKHEDDARSYEVSEFEVGVEWQPLKQFELVVMYTISKRRYEDHSLKNNLQRGNLLRLQAQINF